MCQIPKCFYNCRDGLPGHPSGSWHSSEEHYSTTREVAGAGATRKERASSQALNREEKACEGLAALNGSHPSRWKGSQPPLQRCEGPGWGLSIFFPHQFSAFPFLHVFLKTAQPCPLPTMLHSFAHGMSQGPQAPLSLLSAPPVQIAGSWVAQSWVKPL